MKKYLFIVMSIVGIFLMCSQAWAQEQVVRKVLDNGMVVLAQRMPEASSVAMQATFRIGGAREEGCVGCGISHFIEHMFFKGTQRRGVSQIPREIQALGGWMNAMTSYDVTSFVVEFPSAHLAQAMDIFSDMIMNPVFDVVEVEKERDVILSEMRMRNDNPDIVLSEMIFPSVFKQHPYRHPLIGYEPIFRAITRDALVSFYQKNFLPNNMVLAMVGPLDPHQAIELADQAFKDFVPRPLMNKPLILEPEQTAERFVEQTYPTSLTRLGLAFRGVALSDPDMMALDLLSIILGRGRSSRLYQQMVEKQKIASSVYVSNSTLQEHGFFEIRCTLKDGDVQSALALIREEIDRVKTKGVRVDELAKAKKSLRSDYIFGQQTPMGVASDLAYQEAMMFDHQFSKKYIESIDQVTIDEIKRVARQYLIEPRSTVAVLSSTGQDPLSARDDDQVSNINDLERFVLESGLTVLIQRDARLPIVFSAVVFDGGSLREPIEQSGLSQLTSQMLTQGTKTLTSEQLFNKIESKGMRLDAFSNQDMLGISLTALSEDTASVLNILNDLVRHPRFDQQDFIKEKDKLKQAIIRRKDSIFSVALDGIKDLLFPDHGYGQPTAGSLDSVERITQSDILDFYQHHRTADQMTVVVFGDIEVDEVLRTITRQYSFLKPRGTDPLLVAPMEDHGAQNKTVTLDKQQAVSVFAFATPGSTIRRNDLYGLEVIATVLGSSMNGRLFQRVRNELGRAYAVGGSVASWQYAGMLFFYVASQQQYLDTISSIVAEEIEAIKNGNISDEEIARAKTFLVHQYQRQIETIAQRGLVSAFDERRGVGYDFYRDYASGMEQLTKDEIIAVAKKYLGLDRMNNFTVIPKSVVQSETKEAIEQLSSDETTGL